MKIDGKMLRAALTIIAASNPPWVPVGVSSNGSRDGRVLTMDEFAALVMLPHPVRPIFRDPMTWEPIAALNAPFEVEAA